MKNLIISVFTVFDPASPKFLVPLGPPNGRFVGNGVNERNLIFRIVLANPDTEPYSATGIFVASIGGGGSVTWPRSVSIQAGGFVMFQGRGPAVDDGIGCLDTLGMPDGPADLDVCFKQNVPNGPPEEVARCICPLIVKGQDLYSGGPEHPPIPQSPEQELTAKEARLVVLTQTIGAAMEETEAVKPRIAKLKIFLDK
jgi:hypothetical protein